MKKLVPAKRKILFFTLIMVALCSCSSEKEEAVSKVTLAHDKGVIPMFQENFIRQGKQAKKAVGIDICPIPSDTPEVYRHRMRAILPTEQAPDLFVWWAQFRVRELVQQNLVGDLTLLWDKYGQDYSPGMREAFTIDGRIYGFPFVVEYWPVWYNKRIFRRLGLFPPSTWKEFIHVCQSIKARGIPPLLLSLQDGWPAFIWFEEMIIGQDPDLYRDLCLGRVRYTDPRVIKAVALWKQMIDKGYFTDPSANMFTNAGYLWNKERFAMVLCGTWYYSGVLKAQGIHEEDIGVFILPSHNAGAGNNIVFEVGPVFTAKNSLHVREAKKVADWWMSSEGSGYFASMHGAYPGNLKTDTTYLAPVKKELLLIIQNDHYRILNRYWEATPPAICEKAVDKLTQFILEPEEMYKVLEDIERLAKAYWETGQNPRKEKLP